MKFWKRIFILLVLSSTFISVLFCQVPIFDEKDDDLISRAYYFYPSVLRIINVGDDPSFYSLIRKVELVVAHRFSFGTKHPSYAKTISDIEAKGFEEYMSLSNTEMQLLIYGKESPQETVLIMGEQEQGLFVDILGTINVFALTQFTESVRKSDSAFLNVFDLIGYKEKEKNESPSDSTDTKMDDQ